MKCPACKYENRTKEILTEKVIRFKSGKRKGEIKEIKEEYKTIYPRDPEFIELVTKQGDSFEEAGASDYTYSFFGRYERNECTLMGCPICGTVFIKEINERNHVEF